MNQRPIGMKTLSLLLISLLAIIALLIRRDQLTRRLLVRTINDIVEGSHG